MSKGYRTYSILQYRNSGKEEISDPLIIEEPLEIRLIYFNRDKTRRKKRVAVTMRTPGQDASLVRGFLFSEGIIEHFDDIDSIEIDENILTVSLKQDVMIDPSLLDRNFYTTSSCGVCGKASIESIHFESQYLPWSDRMQVSLGTLLQIEQAFIGELPLFKNTGGNHGVILFDANGDVVDVKEDVGRHNAMDKIIGDVAKLPVHNHIVAVSGRASFELVQKAARAGIPVFVSIGAPSSLAVELAEEHGVTLIGFLKTDSFNVYSRKDRILF